MATDRDVARLRQKYTGEARAVALEWYRTNGLHQGLVPDAADWVQELLEAGVLRALVRSVLGVGQQASSGTLFGVSATSPSADGLTVWVKDADVPLVLGRLLPVQSGSDLTGVPWLRPWMSEGEDLVLGLIGRRAHITVRVQHSSGAGRTARAWSRRAGPEDLERARGWVIGAGGTPCWTEPVPQLVEGGPLELLSRPFTADEAARWSRALRRAGLFLERLPDWRSLPPAAEDLEGPNPVRIQPRAAGPARASGGAVVAVTSADGRGAYGCTTTSLVLAAALARSGHRILVLGGGDPNGVTELFRDRPTPGFAGGGSLNVGLLPDDSEAAREVVARSRHEGYGVIVLDPGFQQRSLVSESDLLLAVMTDRPRGGGDRSLWRDRKVVDGRPEHVRLWQWLDDEFVHRPGPASGPAEQVMTFLDVMFDVVYVPARAEDGDPSVYDVADAEAVEEWWGDFDYVLNGFRTPSDEDEDEDEDGGDLDGGTSAGKDEVRQDVDLDAWRADFIRFLGPEGARRHPGQWAVAAAGWAERHRERQLAGLAPGESTKDEWRVVLTAFCADVEESAVKRWGRGLWEEQRARWVEAFIRDEDLLEPFEDLIGYEDVPRRGADVAQDLAGGVRGLPPMPMAGVLARARHAIDAHQLNETAAAVTAYGLAGLTVLPQLPEWQTLWSDPGILATPSPRAASASLALARTVMEQLPLRPRGERA